MNKIRVMILEKNLKERLDLENHFSTLDDMVMTKVPKNMAEALTMISRDEVDVVLVSHDYDGDGYNVSEQIRASYPRKAIVIIEEEFTDSTVSNIIAAGARDVLIRPIRSNILHDSIIKAFNMVVEISKKIEIAELKKKGFNNTQILSVYSTKGGTGKTFFAINLALALVRETGKKVALLDLDTDYSGITQGLDLQPKNTLHDVLMAIENIDKDNIESFMTIHDSGLKILAGINEPQENDFISAAQVEIIVKHIYDNFDYVVIDMSDRFKLFSIPALNYARKLFLLMNPEISSVSYTKMALRNLAEYSFPAEKIRLILNKQSAHAGLKAGDIEKALSRNIDYVLKEDQKVTSTLNVGEPFFTKYPKHDIARVFSRIVKDINTPGKGEIL